MTLLFWICAVLVGYTYFGYGVALWIQVLVRPRSFLQSLNPRPVSIIMAVRNEEANLPAKLENLRGLTYPRGLLQIVIASDGSTDETVAILQNNVPIVVPVILRDCNGKASALNEAVKHATGEILIFLDVRQVVESNAISELVACFADATIGAVSGELLLESSTSSDALGAYWKIEKMVRKLESASGSVVGVTGAIYAIRRELYSEIPIGTILDDVYQPMQVARAGKRVVFQPSAIARDKIFSEPGKEFSRKVRTLTGNYQLIKLSPWLLTWANPLLGRFISHKVLRLFVPVWLLLMPIACWSSPSIFYQSLFWLQAVFYSLASIGWLNPTTRRYKPVSIASTFVMLNAAAAVAMYNFIVGRKEVWL